MTDQQTTTTTEVVAATVVPSTPAETAEAVTIVHEQPAADTQALAVHGSAELVNPFAGEGTFVLAQRMAKLLASSTIVPEAFRNNVPNCLIALQVSQQMQQSVLSVMQNLYIIKGKPSWSSKFLIGLINASGLFGRLDFQLSGEGEDRGCKVVAVSRATGAIIEGPRVTMKMAKAEGWLDKSESKWKTMPEVMLHYRAASFFANIHCPDLTLGFRTVEDIEDTDTVVGSVSVQEKANRLQRIRNGEG